LSCKRPAEEDEGKVFNVATGQRIDLNETFKMLKKITGFKGDVKH
ncbi:MAG: biosynthesis protein WbpP, partial [Acidobacteriaceae bacterium]|nr:biosynthesis protein WbpP [Acidobacteriaceae bacterium]